MLIQLDSRPIGVLSVFSYEDQSAYNHKDLELLDFISGQITLSMERKLNTEKIQNQGARINAIFESSTHQIWSLDSELRFTSFNQNYAEAFEAYYGHEPKIGMSLKDQDPHTMSHKASDFWQKYEHVFKGNTLNFQTSQKTLDGQKCGVTSSSTPFSCQMGAFMKISAIANDITEKKLSETALMESEEKFRNIFESFQDIYFRCNMDGIISLVSPSVKRVLGFDQEEVVGKKLPTISISKSKLSDLFKELYKDKQVQNYEGVVVTKEGNEIQFLSNVRLIKRRKNKYEIEGIARDFTRLKETNRQLREAKELAERPVDQREDFWPI